jgi:hypothetical protein
MAESVVNGFGKQVSRAVLIFCDGGLLLMGQGKEIHGWGRG